MLILEDVEGGGPTALGDVGDERVTIFLSSQGGNSEFLPGPALILFLVGVGVLGGVKRADVTGFGDLASSELRSLFLFEWRVNFADDVIVIMSCDSMKEGEGVSRSVTEDTPPRLQGMASSTHSWQR